MKMAHPIMENEIAQETLKAIASSLGDSEGQAFFQIDNRSVIQFEDSDENADDLWETIEAQPDNFIAINSLPANEAFDVMKEYTMEMDDLELAAYLNEALGQERPFAIFKLRLNDRGGSAYKDWASFKETKYIAKAEDWLKNNGLI